MMEKGIKRILLPLSVSVLLFRGDELFTIT